ncbi:unnamed protein product, partial [Heterosigma akashiwo]
MAARELGLVVACRLTSCRLALVLLLCSAANLLVSSFSLKTAGSGSTLQKKPPGKFDFPVVTNVAETFAYLSDPDGFISSRSKQFGPIFSTYLFFRKTVVVGSQQLVKEFVATEREAGITKSSLPPVFTKLHTQYGALNLEGELHRDARNGLDAILGADAIRNEYMPIIDVRTTEMVAQLSNMVDQGQSIFIAPALKKFYLNLFSELFTGEPLSDHERSLFELYNAGLLALSEGTEDFKKANAALEELVEIMRGRFLRASEGGIEPANFCMRTMHGMGWTTEAISTRLVLLVWGAYIEAASLGAFALLFLKDRPDVADKVIDEAVAAQLFSADSSQAGQSPWQQMLYTQGVLRESLRLHPPAGGGFRYSDADFELGGYRIEAGTVLTADPRIGNTDPALFADPDRFAPERWVDTRGKVVAEGGGGGCPVAGAARRLGLGAFFPGGVGAHQCPGVLLAEAAGTALLVRWLAAFEAWAPAEGAPLSEGTAAAAEGWPREVALPIRVPVDGYALRLEGRR